MVGTIKKKFKIATTVMIPTSANPLCSTSIKATGSSSSTWPRSLENLFKILPELLKLKKFIRALVTALNMWLCRLRDARVQALNKAVELKSVTTIVRAIMPV